MTSMRSRIRSRGALVSAGFTAVAALSVTLAAPASAAGFEYQHVESRSWSTGSYFCTANGEPGNHSAVACFSPNDDYIQPGDLRSDGKRVAVQWKTSYGRSGLCVNAEGKDARYDADGMISPAQGKHLCNKNFREGPTITYRAGTCDGDHADCSRLRNWGEWTPWQTRRTNE